MTLAPLGDSAVVVTVGVTVDESVLGRVRSLARALESEPGVGIVDVVPAYASVTVFYETLPGDSGADSPYVRVCRAIEACAARFDAAGRELRRPKHAPAAESPREMEIPVCYERPFAPDLDAVARHCDLSAAEVAKLHANAAYRVHAVGFAPGFAYLGGLPEQLFIPRRPTPRTRVPAGSVGIGWQHSGVYPLEMPGGWQLIGRTPLTMFHVDATAPVRLQVGDRVRFRAITVQEFSTWR